jgi:hypothetical protein
MILMPMKLDQQLTSTQDVEDQEGDRLKMINDDFFELKNAFGMKREARRKQACKVIEKSEIDDAFEGEKRWKKGHFCRTIR